MRILFLDAYFEPEQIAFTHLEKDLLKGLVQAGHEIEIVCPPPTRGVSAEIAKEYKKIKSEILYSGHVHVTRFSAPQEGKNPIVRALRYFWCNLRSYQVGKNIKNIDVVFANSTPPTQGMLGIMVAKSLSKKNNRKVPFVFSLQDIFPDSLVNAKMTKKGSLIWKIGRRIEDFTYRSADKIIVISEGFKLNIMEKGVPEKKIVVIPNWVNTSTVYPVDRKDNILFDRYNLDRGKFYICYSGNIGHSQNLEFLVEVAKQLEKDLPNMRFVLIGEGAAKEKLVKKIADGRINNIIMLPFQPYEDIAHVFSFGDVGLIVSKPGIGGSSVPSKTWSIMAAGRPVLASFDLTGQLFEVIQETNAGIVVAPGDTEQMIGAINKLYTDEKIRAKFGTEGNKYINEKMNKEKCIVKYIDVLSGCNSEKK